MLLALAALPSLLCAGPSPATGQDVLVEAEGFEEHGGCAAYGCSNHTARIAAGRVAPERTGEK